MVQAAPIKRINELIDSGVCGLGGRVIDAQVLQLLTINVTVFCVWPSSNLSTPSACELRMGFWYRSPSAIRLTDDYWREQVISPTRRFADIRMLAYEILNHLD